MSIPKCKNCEFYHSERRENYWKDHIDNYCYGLKTTDTEGYEVGEKKFIYAKELKTSPKWCPKRI